MHMRPVRSKGSGQPCACMLTPCLPEKNRSALALHMFVPAADMINLLTAHSTACFSVGEPQY